MAKVTFNQRVLRTTGVSLAALLIIIAGNAKSLFEGLQGLPVFITAMANGLPLGVGSYLLVQTAGPLFHHFLLKWLPVPQTSGSSWRDFFAEMVTFAGCSAALLAQMWGGTRSEMLLAGLLGAIAGLSSPLILKGLKSVTEVKG